MLQAGVLLLAMIRLISQIAFQPRLSVISGTLAAAIPDLAGFAITVTTISAMMCFVFILVFGTEFNKVRVRWQIYSAITWEVHIRGMRFWPQAWDSTQLWAGVPRNCMSWN